MSEVALCMAAVLVAIPVSRETVRHDGVLDAPGLATFETIELQGYLAHKKTPNPLGPPRDPRQRPTVGS